MAEERWRYLQWAIVAAGAVAAVCLVWFYLIPKPTPRDPTLEELREVLENGPSGGTTYEIAQARADAADRLGTWHGEEIRQALAGGNPEEARRAQREAVARAAPTMSLLFAVMDDDNPMVRARAGAAARKIMNADYGFRADDPPARRRGCTTEMKRDWESFVKAIEKRKTGAKPAPHK